LEKEGEGENRGKYRIQTRSIREKEKQIRKKTKANQQVSTTLAQGYKGKQHPTTIAPPTEQQLYATPKTKQTAPVPRKN
jgi:hypothetical protein